MTRLALVLGAIAVLALPTSAGAQVGVGSAGWFWSSPTPQGNSLTALQFSSGRGYAVGYNTLLRTDDGGNSFTGLRPFGLPFRMFEGYEPRLAVPAPNTFVAFSRDYPCSVWRSDDAGATVRRLDLVPRGTRCPTKITTIAFPSPAIGYAFAQDGSVYRTADGGVSWQRRATLQTGVGILSASFADGSRGLAVQGGSLFRTGDGGGSWAQVPGVAGAVSVTFASSQRAYVAGRGLMRSSDGGGSFTTVPLTGVQADRNYSDVTCATENRCMAKTQTLTYQTAVISTPDAGQTATEAVVQSGHAMGFASPSRAIVVGGDGLTSVSDDGGTTFRRVGTGSIGVDGIRAESANRVVGWGLESLFRTDDGGRNWREVQVPNRKSLIDAAIPSGTVMYALEVTGDLLRTENGAGDWQETAPTGGKTQAILALSPKRLLLAGTAGVFVSGDGGRTVKAIRSGAFFDLDRAGQAVLAYGSRRLDISTDGGRRWRRIRRPNRTPITEADFVTKRTGYVVNQAGNLYRTRNGGRSWRRLPGVGGHPVGIAFAHPARGFVQTQGEGETGLLLRTDDGGRTFRPQYLEDFYYEYGDVAAVDARIGFAVGRSVHATRTGGDLGTRKSQLTISAPRRRLRAGASVTVRGRLKPALEGQPIFVSVRSTLDGWIRTLVRTDARGAYALTFRARGSGAVVAQWEGTARFRGTGTTAKPLKVKKPRRKRSRR